MISRRLRRFCLPNQSKIQSAEIIDPAQLGGTRHLSAAQFAQDQRDAFALVASQDRRFTLLAWSSCDGMVHAHRIETLLM